MRLCKDGLNQATSRSKGRADGDDSDDDWGGWKAVAATPVEVMEVDDEEEDGPPHWPRAPQETPEIDEKDRAVAQNIYAAPQETPWRISARAPKNPPGKHWTRYDHGNGLFWWYYEGPKGTWWMDEREHAEPEPYPVDPVEEISSEDA